MGRRYAAALLVAGLAAACSPVSSPVPSGGVPPGPTQVPATTPDVPPASPAAEVALALREFDVPAGSHPHDVAPAADGGVWYTGQHVGTLGHLDPGTGTVREIPLGNGSSPHGVIVGPDGAPARSPLRACRSAFCDHHELVDSRLGAPEPARSAQ